jgi:hypothetical protein
MIKNVRNMREGQRRLEERASGIAYSMLKKDSERPRTLSIKRNGFEQPFGKGRMGRDNSRERCRKIGVSEQTSL